MELLIPGLILVALMVYASTRIRRSAARAFEAETIETDEFVIQKPEGFLNVIGGDERYAFEAYSKEFGGEGAEEIRQATVKVTIGAPQTSAGEIVSEQNETRDDVHYRVVESKRMEEDVGYRVLSKATERNGKTYTLEVVALAKAAPELSVKIEEMLDSFAVK